MRKHVVALACSVALLSSGCGRGDVKPQAPVVPSEAGPSCSRGRAFIVVRHAEKASADRDTSLSERGQARARALASILGTAGVTRLVATQYKRTQETLAPLAARLALPVDVRPADKTSDLIDELRAAPDGAVVVVATHSNVMPQIVKAIGDASLRGVAGDAIPEDDFSRVVVITQPCGASRPFVLELGSGE